jgi:prepilin-type processing-associated H-X9-DG protein
MTQTPPPISESPHDHQYEEPRGKGLAIGALVLGLLGLIPFVGPLLALVGIILGIVALVKHAPGRGLAVGGIIAGLLSPLTTVLLVGAVLIPAYGHARERAMRARCGANLNGIAKATIVYQTQYLDEWPADLQALVADGTVPTEMLLCPSIESGRDVDYFYLPPNQPADALAAPESVIIACDYRDNHAGKGRNVLYADGHVMWLEEVDFQAELGYAENAAFAAALRAKEGP